jgi:hypothetical protein
VRFEINIINKVVIFLEVSAYIDRGELEQGNRRKYRKKEKV